ncbi:MAG TPA: hypothetical protein PKA33_16045 [Amaricoccus sp.]|uniref:hypothetical protein n=1 Tax=Amaricoccus sp. TaxID=1872485 RepID=UPI002C0FBB74|nr:hypothetical protein [Amaricoccus sp.]HMQ92486.1 hypothetical protein [Amaricoccus sp.]HMR53865.1 hypothetical protein [Amaricoccus sp.]HMR58982.1 hypothetical protein [Amaricoccus sp.]HMU00860.1 hypothetical protein [Amaricoccus sp.]
MSDALLQRLMAASHGRVPVDTLSCPEWGYETVQFAARGSWSPALQTMVLHEIAADFGRCSACGQAAIEEPMFLAPATVFAHAAEFLLRPAPTSIRSGAVVYECKSCGSDQVDFGVKVRRDPIAAEWPVESVDDAGHFCLSCGSADCGPVPRPMSAVERWQAQVELRRLAKSHAARVADVRRLLAFVSGLRR